MPKLAELKKKTYKVRITIDEVFEVMAIDEDDAIMEAYENLDPYFYSDIEEYPADDEPLENGDTAKVHPNQISF